MALPLVPVVGGAIREGVKRFIAPAVVEGVGYVVKRAFTSEGKNIIAPPKIEMPAPINNAAYQGGGLLSRLDKQNELLEQLIRNYQLSNMLKIASDEQLGEIAVNAIGQGVVDPNQKTTPTTTADKFEQLLDALNENLKKSNEIIEEQSKTIKEIKETKLKEIEELKGIGQKKIEFDPITKSIQELKNIGLTAKVENNLKVANEVKIKDLNIAQKLEIPELKAKLNLTDPVEINLPQSVTDYQNKMLEQEKKEVEIINERAEFDKKEIEITDLDGESVVKASPREIVAKYHATKTRTATDENNFKLEDGDIDDLLPKLPNIAGILNFALPGSIDKNFSGK